MMSDSPGSWPYTNSHSLCNTFIISTAKESGAIILPQFVNFSDKDGNYMSIDSSDSLVCNKKEPDADCTFEVMIPDPPYEGVRFKGANGLYIHQYYGDDGWFRCDDSEDGGGHILEVIHTKCNQVYLHTRYVDFAEFITNRYHSSNGLAATPYAGPECLFTVSEPIISKEIISIVYDLPNALMADVPSLVALDTTVRNDSQTSDVVEKLPYSYTRFKVGTWKNVAGVEIGAEVWFEAGVPVISSDSDSTLSLPPPYRHKWGGSEGTEETITSFTQITIPAGKKGKVKVLVLRKKIDVPFIYKEEIVYKDRKTKINDKKGVYNNVESYTVDVQVGDWEDT